jgi:hypothetical protein
MFDSVNSTNEARQSFRNTLGARTIFRTSLLTSMRTSLGSVASLVLYAQKPVQIKSIKYAEDH